MSGFDGMTSGKYVSYFLHDLQDATTAVILCVSGGGQLLCVANINSNGYDYITLLNLDATVSTLTNTYRFACLVSLIFFITHRIILRCSK